ncbi:uncharacterized protein LOC117100414 isoform X2 [Anneissia japonica]|uniref:uncharacterized protein LOC117100414 isoform X1 n=1 Tax=Anneissia japonica TaxID=1529436 RepID=UPI001425B27B|nr:uncharacterized protein LOC117100414 isoform X1 [Anneissia japonica]XP_033095992.1 uncharacterized protein LOC117100414 isoform X2 [Anneissia japonica]
MFSFQMDSKDTDDSVSENGRPATPPFGFDDIPGLNIKTEQTTVDTVLGKRRTVSSITKIELAFVTVAAISVLSTIGLTITVITLLEKADEKPSADLVFAIVLLINSLFCLYYVVDGVFFESAYEIVVFVGAAFILLIYCIISFTQSTGDTVKTVRFYLIIILGPCCFILGSILAKNYYESKNIIFRTVGASVELQNMCGLMLFFQTLLKFDLQLEVSMVVFVLSDNTSNIGMQDSLILGFGLIYSVVWAAIGFLSVRYESRNLVIFFYVTSIAEPAYIIYKMVDVIDHGLEDLILSAIITCGVIGLLIRLVTCITMFFVYKNFGNGLKEKVYGQTSGDTAAVIKNEGASQPQLPPPQSI